MYPPSLASTTPIASGGPLQFLSSDTEQWVSNKSGRSTPTPQVSKEPLLTEHYRGPYPRVYCAPARRSYRCRGGVHGTHRPCVLKIYCPKPKHAGLTAGCFVTAYQAYQARNCRRSPWYQERAHGRSSVCCPLQTAPVGRRQGRDRSDRRLRFTLHMCRYSSSWFNQCFFF